MKQKGFVLFAVMIFLIIMSMLGISMFGGFIKDQKISGNLNEKQRAIEASQAGLDAVQFWMLQPGNIFSGVWNTGINCTSTTQTGASAVVCSNALASPATLPWSSSNTFQPPNMTVIAGGGANSYASQVNYHIQFMGPTPISPTAPKAYYKVTSTAQGGNATAAAVVETIFEVTVSARDISGG
ncbi:hypothetical protein DIC66_03215 [Rhodoferax lacus]|uniref:Uncharacterized protein n=1 Tax=Rhodoferax lacus TaxID=2184758 RepID=A0A3E1RHT1_9BURK|nr:hypothetical protein [Rhodoferax lacus]RFO98894.1 hypothetical protein DIC66_03215 [Rhodoferax lacus]